MGSLFVAGVTQNHAIIIEGVQVPFLPRVLGHWPHPEIWRRYTKSKTTAATRSTNTVPSIALTHLLVRRAPLNVMSHHWRNDAATTTIAATRLRSDDNFSGVILMDLPR